MSARQFGSAVLAGIVIAVQVLMLVGRAVPTPAVAAPAGPKTETRTAAPPTWDVAASVTKPPKALYPRATSPANTQATVAFGTGNNNYGQQQRDTDNPQNHPGHHFAGSVNLLNGNYFLTAGDFFIPGRGLSLQLARSYNSLAAAKGELGAFGFGWTHSYETQVISETGGLVLQVVESDGAVHIYTDPQPCPDGTDTCYTPPPGLYRELRAVSDGTFQLTHKNGTTQAFNEDGQLIAIRDRHENAVRMHYNGSSADCIIPGPVGTLCRADGPSGARALLFGYDESLGYPLVGIITEWLDGSEGRAITYQYDDQGNLIDVGYPEEPDNTINYDYDPNHRMVSYDDPRQPAGVRQAQAIIYDTQDRVITATHYADSFFDVFYQIDYNPPDAEPGHTFISDPAQNPVGAVEVSDGEGGTSRVEYDAQGNVTYEGDWFPEYGWWWGKWWWWHPTEWWLLARKVDANGNTTEYAYDAWGNTTAVTNALGATQRFRYEEPAYEAPAGMAFGNVLSATNSLGVTTLYEHDHGANTLTEIQAVGLPEQTETVYQSDIHGQLVAEIDVTMVRVTEYGYDAWGNTTVITDAMGAVTHNRYDEVGRPEVTVDQAGHETIYLYDAADRLKAVIDPLGGATEYVYSPDGRDNLIELTNANGVTTTYTYDPLDRLVAETNSLGEMTTYEYDNLNRLVTRMDATGRVTHYTYDAKSRMRLAESYEAGAETPTQTNVYRYDGAGNLVAMANAHVRLAYTYDALDQRTQIEMWTPAWGMTKTVVLNREDLAGNLMQVVGPEGYQLNYEYDNLNRLEAVTDGMGDTTRYVYDPGGRPATITYPDGTVVTHKYDPLNRLTGLTHNLTSSDDLIYSYRYDSRGNMIGEMDLSEVYTNTYDAVGRVMTSTGGTEGEVAYGYDGVGNRLSATTTETTTTFTYDAHNRLQTAGDATLGYDAMGARTSLQRAAPTAVAMGGMGMQPTAPSAPAQPAGTVNYRYDTDMRLVEVEQDGEVHRFLYDPLGNLIGYVDGDGETHYYLRDGEDIYIELDAAGNVIASYTLGAQGVVSMMQAGTRYLLLYDGQGRVRQVIDLATGAIVLQYGRHLLAPGVGPVDFYNPIRVRGAWWFPGIHLVLFGEGVFWDPWYGVFLVKAWPWLYWPFGPFHPWRPVFRFWPWPWPWPRPGGWAWPRRWRFLWPWPGAWTRPWLIWPVWPWGLRFSWPWWYWRAWWGWTWWGRWWCWHPWWWWTKWWWWAWWHPYWWWPYWWWPWWWWAPCWWWPWHWWWWIWWAPGWWFWWPGQFWWCWWWWWPWPWWWPWRWGWWWTPSLAMPPDFGDAPDPPYRSLAWRGGAIHGIWWYEWLGRWRDGEWDSHQVDRDRYDDGIAVAPVQQTLTFTPTVAYPAPNARYHSATPLHVHGWIDWNRDGDWLDAGEWLVNWSGYPGQVGVWPAGQPSLGVTQPFTLPSGLFGNDDLIDLWLRFRLDYGANYEQPTGYTRFGEVEDHKLTLARVHRPAWDDLTLAIDATPIITYATVVTGVQVSINPTVVITPVWSGLTPLAATSGAGNRFVLEHAPFTAGTTYTLTLSAGRTHPDSGVVLPAALTFTAEPRRIFLPVVFKVYTVP